MNRIAVEQDRTIYGDYITVGDLIIDTPTKVFTDGTKEVNYYFMGREWPKIRENATIWVDGSKLGELKGLQFRNTSVSATPWTITSARIKNIPNTKVLTGGLSCHGLLNWTLDGVSEQYPGLSKWNPFRKFATGYFGFHVKCLNRFGGHNIEGAVLNGGNINLRGFEVEQGFSGVRLHSAEIESYVNSLTIENFYIHDTFRGEGFYLGTTQAGPAAKLKNLKIHNGFLVRTGAESVQVQHVAGGCDIKNLIVYAADMDWLNAFQPGQDTGLQYVVASGINKMSYIIVDGFASQGMQIFGSDMDLANVSGSMGNAENILFNDGRHTGMYFNKSAKQGTKWNFDKLYFRAFNNTYNSIAGQPLRNHVLNRKYATDEIVWGTIIHDGSKESLFEVKTDNTAKEVILNTNLPAPKYYNSGFNELASKISTWSQFFAKHFFNPNSVVWTAGTIAIDITDTRHVFCKCLETHTATDVRPVENPKFMVLTWDENGIRNDQSGWVNSTQSFTPPDDFRLTYDCYWRKLGYGVQGIIQKEIINDDYYFDGKRITTTNEHTYTT